MAKEQQIHKYWLILATDVRELQHNNAIGCFARKLFCSLPFMIFLPITRNLLSRKGEIAGATDKEWDLYQIHVNLILTSRRDLYQIYVNLILTRRWDLYQIYVNLIRVNRENRLFVLQNLYTGGSGFKHLFIWRLESSFSRVSEWVRYLRAG